MQKVSSSSFPIEHVIELANVHLPASQFSSFARKLLAVTNYMNEIKKLDLKSVPETSRVSDEENVVREDEVQASLSQDAALQNAKATHDGFFMVSAIFEDRG